MPRTTAKTPQWVKELRSALKRECGAGWTVRGLGTDPLRQRVQLTVRFEDEGKPAEEQSRVSTMLGPKDKSDPAFLPYDGKHATDIVAMAKEIKRLMLEGQSLEEAALLLGKKSAVSSVTGDLDWVVLAEKFKRSKINSGEVSERTYHRNYRAVIEKAVAGLTGRNGISTGKGLLEHLLEQYGGEPGSTGRRLRMQYTAQFLKFALAQGAPARWKPPTELTPFVGAKQKGHELTTYASDDQISRLLAHLQGRNREWFNAIGLMICFGLRGVEVGQCRSAGDTLFVTYQKRTAKKRSGTPPRHVVALDPIGWEGLGDNLLAQLAEQGDSILPVCCRGENATGAGDGINQYLKRLPLWRELVQEVAATPVVGNTGNELVPYSLRHAYAARADEMGLSDRQASMWMGHSLQTHQGHYSGVTEDTHAKAIAKVKAAVARRKLEALVG